MIIAVIVFLFVLYCILETCKFNKVRYEMVGSGDRKKLKKNRKRNKGVCYAKIVVFTLLYIMVIINHYTDPLSNSGGIRSFLILLVGMTFFMAVCIIDIVKVRNTKDDKD